MMDRVINRPSPIFAINWNRRYDQHRRRINDGRSDAYRRWRTNSWRWCHNDGRRAADNHRWGAGNDRYWSGHNDRHRAPDAKAEVEVRASCLGGCDDRLTILG